MNEKLSVSLATHPSIRPTNYRYGVLAFVCILSMITYLDRVAFGSATSDIIKALGLQSEAELYWAYTAFAFAYAAFEIPSGWLGDVFGPRKTLIRIVLWWSFFTALTGCITATGLMFLDLPNSFMVAVGSVGLLAIIRFLFGIGEAGAYPNITRALHNWFPFSQRGFAQGAIWMSGRLVGGLTPVLWWALTVALALEWRWAFWLFAATGVIWCIAFAMWFRNRPEEKEEVNEAERQLITHGRHDTEAGHANVPWGYILSRPNLWFICLMYFCGAYGWYFNITYLPRYLETQFDVQKDDFVLSIYKGGPLWMGAITCLFGGWLTDWIIRKTGNRRWGRRSLGIIGHSLCALCYFACLFTPSAFTFFLAISFAAFFNDLTMGPAWATCQDVGKRYAAIVAGAMNTVGNLGGAAAGWATGAILKYGQGTWAAEHGISVKSLSGEALKDSLAGGYALNFLTFGLVYVIAVVLWFGIDSTKPVVPEEPATPPVPEEDQTDAWAG